MGHRRRFRVGSDLLRRQAQGESLLKVGAERAVAAPSAGPATPSWQKGALLLGFRVSRRTAPFIESVQSSGSRPGFRDHSVHLSIPPLARERLLS